MDNFGLLYWLLSGQLSLRKNATCLPMPWNLWKTAKCKWCNVLRTRNTFTIWRGRCCCRFAFNRVIYNFHLWKYNEMRTVRAEHAKCRGTTTVRCTLSIPKPLKNFQTNLEMHFSSHAFHLSEKMNMHSQSEAIEEAVISYYLVINKTAPSHKRRSTALSPGVNKTWG